MVCEHGIYHIISLYLNGMNSVVHMIWLVCLLVNILVCKCVKSSFDSLFKRFSLFFKNKFHFQPLRYILKQLFTSTPWNSDQNDLYLDAYKEFQLCESNEANCECYSIFISHLTANKGMPLLLGCSLTIRSLVHIQ